MYRCFNVKMEFGIHVENNLSQAVFIEPDSFLFELRNIIAEDGLQVPETYSFLTKNGRVISVQQEKRLKVLSVSDGEKIKVVSAKESYLCANETESVKPDLKVGIIFKTILCNSFL